MHKIALTHTRTGIEYRITVIVVLCCNSRTGGHDLVQLLVLEDACTHPHHFATELEPEQLYIEAEITTSDNIVVTKIHMRIKDTSRTQDIHR